MKVNISLNDDLVSRIDNYADSNYMSRSGLISLATTNFLNQADVLTLIKDMSLAMQKISDKGNVDHETMEQLEDFMRFAKMLDVNIK